MIVVDNAAIVDAITGLTDTRELKNHLAAHQLHAPTLLDYEVVAAIRGLTLGGHLSVSRAEDALTDFDALPIKRWPAGHGLRKRAWQLRDNVSAYDAAYLALAETLSCPLVTRDVRLAKSSGHDVAIHVL